MTDAQRKVNEAARAFCEVWARTERPDWYQRKQDAVTALHSAVAALDAEGKPAPRRKSRHICNAVRLWMGI